MDTIYRKLVLFAYFLAYSVIILVFLKCNKSFEFPEKNIVYTSDISSQEDLYLFQNTRTDFFITEATHLPYSKLEDIIPIYSPDKIYLTHIDSEKELQNWYKNLPSGKKEKFIITTDGMAVRL